MHRTLNRNRDEEANGTTGGDLSDACIKTAFWERQAFEQLQMAKSAKRVAARKRTWARKEKKDRRNLKMWADGARESVLQPHIAGYTDALERGWRAERDYVREVCREFHARISWRLADDEEPDEPLPEWDPQAIPEPEELDDEDTRAKRERVETMNAVGDFAVIAVERVTYTLCFSPFHFLFINDIVRTCLAGSLCIDIYDDDTRINRWLKYRARKIQKRAMARDRTKDPWGLYLSKLAGLTSPPKARQAFQQYMHESYETDIKPVVEARWRGSALEEDGVARELFKELSAEEQKALGDRAKGLAKSERDEFPGEDESPGVEGSGG
ncbi:hypothetical protein R3P38DRAFT_3187022 [Favolaschia claudopus]|uniref:Uncharacterized protein n=1 Tax=Favolaschia claudopus TaxID=2862362 RepID=A0AAW0BY33_9AGAR